MKISRNYIVVTPCRNEVENLPNLIESIVMQTLKPVLWVIVDDNSTDGTQKIITHALKKHDWIKNIRLKDENEYLGVHYAYVCNMGFNFIEAHCQPNGIPYEYIAVADADNILEQNYFEKLIMEFEKDLKLGIASGHSAFSEINKVLDGLKKNNLTTSVMGHEFWKLYGSSQMVVQESYRNDIPMGSARIWKKACFEETGGYAYSYSPDSISIVKAKMKGWKTKRFKHAKVIERRGSTAQGFWNGYKNRGESDFFLWTPLYLAVLKALMHSTKRPYYIGVAYFIGYIVPFISGKKRILDKDIKQYYLYVHPLELINYYKTRLKNIGKYLMRH